MKDSLGIPMTRRQERRARAILAVANSVFAVALAVACVIWRNGFADGVFAAFAVLAAGVAFLNLRKALRLR